MSGAIHPFPHYAFMAWCLVKKKHRDNFTFTNYIKNIEALSYTSTPPIRLHGVVIRVQGQIYLCFTFSPSVRGKDLFFI
jgi:hypothetical protein